MSGSLPQLLLFCTFLFFLQGLAALPWLFAVNGRPFGEMKKTLLMVLGLVTAAGPAFALSMDFNSDQGVLAFWGRLYTSVLHLQLILDFLAVVFWAMLTFWPKGGAVALAAFQEGVRQPLFWMLTILASLVMVVSIVIPYFTFGEDLKMVKEICYAFTMLVPVAFGIFAACISVSEEIEGRTAVTLLSKPISRRQFLMGKFFGIMLASLFMTALMGWMLIWVILGKTLYDAGLPGIEMPVDPAWVTAWVENTMGRSSSGDLLRGIGLWIGDTLTALPGLTIGFCQVLVLIAVAVAVATRLPMLVNIPFCILVFFLGHLTPIMSEVSRGKFKLVEFVSELFGTILPGLDLFDVGSAIVRDVPLDPVQYAIYTLNVVIYALLYAGIATLLGLVLFEDRDVS
jgi:ABC-type transport system involved in multi-copper enzyme maturation permease subunit